MRKRLITVLLAMLIPSGLSAAVPLLPFDEVQPGMTGTGRTVFEGSRIETFDVEILGKLSNIGPDQDLILARCSGGPLERTGVMAGMSGSPVTIDGKLVGAVAYAWSFSTQAIAGITPIEEMLAIASLDGGPTQTRSGTAHPGHALFEPLTDAARIKPFFLDSVAAPLRRPAGALPVTVPLAVSGLGPQGLGKVEPFLGGAGFLPLQVGGAGGGESTAPALQPGSAIGLQLVRGDVEMTATGTVTWVEGERVLAFGHPLFGLGSLDIPMTGATVQTLLPSLMRSSRVASPTTEIGALRQDRASGVFGLLGTQPRMIPVRLQIGDALRGDQVYSFDIADDALLSPLLLYVSLGGILTSRERPAGSATLRLREGSVIKMADGVDVELDNVYAGPQAFEYGTGIAAYVLYLLMNNPWSQPQIVGVNLILEYDELPQSATIRTAALDRYRVRAGESVGFSVVLTPYRGSDRVVASSFRVPEQTPPGRLTVRLGSALSITRNDDLDEPILPRDIDQLIRAINRLRRNDRIHVAATRADSGMLLNGARLTDLPPSAATILTRPKSKGNFVPVPRRAMVEGSLLTDFAVEGSVSLEILVEAP